MTEYKHYPIGGSRMELIAKCPGCVKAAEPYANIPAGEAAQRGTRIHEHMAHAISTGASGKLYALTSSANKAEIEEANLGMLAARKILEAAADHGFTQQELEVEEQLDLAAISDKAGGTPDVIAVRPFHDMLVFDLKTGSRQVTVNDNAQLIFYALCRWLKLEPFVRASINMVHCFIVQPDSDGEIQVKKWSFPAAKLSEYQANITTIIRKVEQDPDYREPGDHCDAKFCPARTQCEAYKQWLNDMSCGAFLRAMQGTKPGLAEFGLGLAEQYKAIPILEAYIKTLKEEVKARLLIDSTSVPGYGLADSLGNRTWNDTKQLAKWAKGLGLKPDDYSPRAFVSPAAIERTLKDKGMKEKIADLDSMTSRPKTGVKVVENEKSGLAEVFSQHAPLQPTAAT